MKKSVKLLLLSLISASFLAHGCSTPDAINLIEEDKSNQEIEIFQEDFSNEDKLDDKSDLSESFSKKYLQKNFMNMEEKSSKNSFAIKANGILEISGNTKDVPRKVLVANNFKANTAYRIEGSSQDKNAKTNIFKFSSKKGWWHDSTRDLNKPVDFIYDPKTFNFEAIASIPYSDSKIGSSYTLSLKEQAVNKKVLDVSFISQNSLKDTLGLVKKYSSEKKRNVKSISDIRFSACAPTSASMLVKYNKKNKKTNLNDEALSLYDLSGTDNNSGTYWGNLLSVLKNTYNLKESYYIGWGNGDFSSNAVKDRMFNTIVEEITAKRPVIFRSHSIPGYPAHYVLVVGFDKMKKSIITNDPGTLKGKNREFSFKTVTNKNPGIMVVK